MSISISDAARIWQVSRTTIYRKRRKGEVCFEETAPATIDPKEMRRVFGEPAAEAAPPPASTNVAAVMPQRTSRLAIREADQASHVPITATSLAPEDQTPRKAAVETIALAAAPSRPGLRASSWPLGALR